MMDKNFTIKPAHWPDDAAALRMIRETVFVKELGVPRELEWDGHDQEATLVLAVFLAGDEERPIGTGRLLPYGQIGRMAVLKDWRGLGVGTAMLKMLLRQACAKGLKNVFLNAQLQAIAFYQRMDFVIVGDVFIEAGIPHRQMQRRCD